jgi:hypothetical protein
VLARIEPAQVKALCNPENYLGSAMAFVDRVLNSAAARR